MLLVLIAAFIFVGSEDIASLKLSKTHDVMNTCLQSGDSSFVLSYNHRTTTLHKIFYSTLDCSGIPAFVQPIDMNFTQDVDVQHSSPIERHIHPSSQNVVVKSNRMDPGEFVSATSVIHSSFQGDSACSGDIKSVSLISIVPENVCALDDITGHFHKYICNVNGTILLIFRYNYDNLEIRHYHRAEVHVP
jgi:hypothetical protein